MSDQNTVMSPQHTCITCQVMFCNLDIQKKHYKCDWHRYNLKRKVAELPPLSADEFKKRVTERKEKNETVINSLQCKACKKHFNSQNQYDNHLNSKKHKDRVAHYVEKCDEDETMPQVSQEKSNDHHKKQIDKMETDSEAESLDSDEWLEDADNPTMRNDCIFCPHHSRSWVKNLKHMTEAHSFFVPDLDYCIDVKGLIEYLGEKVYIGFMCIWCCNKGKSFQSAEAAQAHMIDKGHCKMLHEGENLIEYEDFYDYSSSYPDAENADPDEVVDIPALELESGNYQLVLPSGMVIGHRSLLRYYKQNLKSNSAVSLPKSQKLKKVIAMYKSLGWKGNDKETIVKKVRDLHYMHRVQSKYVMKLSCKQNKLQHHFRLQVAF